MTVVILATIITTAFIPSAKPKTTSFKYVGDIPPVNYFDPLKINSENNYKEERVKYWREAELQHGRTAMLGAVVLPLIELTKPGTMSIDYLSNLDNMMQLPFWLSMFVYECVRMSNGWVNPFVKNGKLFTLKDDQSNMSVCHFILLGSSLVLLLLFFLHIHQDRPSFAEVNSWNQFRQFVLIFLHM